MNTKKLPRIQLDEKHLPYKWQEGLVANKKIGGVFLVFLSGDNRMEIKIKVKKLREFCKTLNGKCNYLAEVRPK